MQTILGAGGAIGFELAKVLPEYTDKVRLVSRNPQRVNPTDELFPAELSDPEQTDMAVAGSEVVYLTVGLEYNTRTWQKVWPQLMRNVIAACKKHQAKLVFFDNVYMYEPRQVYHMTEETPVKPGSKKGLVRAQIAQMLLNEVKLGELQALIARSADFIGLKNSVLVETVYNKLAKGEKAVWFCNADKVHNFTFVPDAGKATALLGNTPDAYGQVWHLPTDKTPIKGKQWIDLIAWQLNTSPRYSVIPSWTMGPLGVFMPVMRELKEMAYQYEQDYFFDSSKFDQRFDFKASSPEEAVLYLGEHLPLP